MVDLMRTPVAQSSHQQIARALGSEILSGVYPPGSTLPNETALLSRFHISRTVLREVIKTLTAKGLVVAKTRIGTRVLDPAHWNFFDAEVLSWKVGLGMDNAFRQSLVEVRRSIEPAAAALIGAARIDETVADDPRAARDGGADRARDMIGARGGEKQGLAARVPAVGGALHQQRADRLRAHASAGFARRHDLDPARAEFGGERAELGRLAAPFPALERDEAPAHQPVSR